VIAVCGVGILVLGWLWSRPLKFKKESKEEQRERLKDFDPHKIGRERK
jgi:hypothetical protein